MYIRTKSGFVRVVRADPRYHYPSVRVRHPNRTAHSQGGKANKN